MALTRPRFGQLNTSIVAEADPITVLHQGATQANVDVGFLFNRANGLVSNVALYWSESSQSIVTAFTSNSGATDSNISVSSYANLTVGNVLLINGTIYAGSTAGVNGQFLQTTGTGMQWANGSFVGGYVAGQSTFGANLVANSATVSSSTTTGALVVVGGVGISGDATVGGNVTYGTPAILNGSGTITSIGTGAKLLDSFATATYRSAKYILSITDVTNTAYQTSEIVLQQDGTYANIASYGLLYSGAAAKMTFSSNIVGGNVMLWGTGVSANNTVKYARTLIPV